MESKPKPLGLKTLIAVSLLANVLLAYGVFAALLENSQYRSQVRVLSDQNRELAEQVLNLKQALELEREQLNYYKSQADYYSLISKQGVAGSSLAGYSRISIVAVRAVSQDPFTSSYQGVVLRGDIELRQGEGRRLVNTEPEIGIDMQTSLRTAASVAEAFTGSSLNTTDVILTIRSGERVEVVDGPSAGAAVTIAIIMAIQNRTVDPDIYITGTINPDGSIGKVGGVLEKALAASRNGARLFLVPQGQSRVQGLRPVKTEPVPGLTIVTYEPFEIDLKEELKKNGYPTEVIEVRNIQEALDAFTNI
ncbi:MAG: S16 family serine protease [Candidatus Bathyarchaeia archaeon]